MSTGLDAVAVLVSVDKRVATSNFDVVCNGFTYFTRESRGVESMLL